MAEQPAALEQAPKRRVKPKVVFGTIGAGVGGGIAALSGPDVAAFIVDVSHLTLSESGMKGLASIVTVAWGILLSAAGSFIPAYAKKE